MRTLIIATTAAATLFSSAAFAQQASQSTVPIPDFSRIWTRSGFPWFEPPASGPGPVTNKSRWPYIVNQRLGGSPGGSPGLPPSKDGQGVSDYDQLVGDYANPILQPWAAAVVKKFGEISLAGITYGNPSNQCWPEPVPFIYKQLRVQIIQQPDTITFLYEGDTLVIDTVAVRSDRPYAMIDLFGTPYTKSLHVVERYRLREYDDIKDALERHKKENWLPAGDIYSGHRGKFLQLHLTIEDEGVFTTPWTATITYVPGPDTWSEVVCAENTHQYYYNNEADVPRTEKPDF